MNELLSAEWLTELEALRRKLRFDVRSRALGDHLSKRKGSGAEFLEHRPYAAGDDLRRLDWAVFARTGEPAIKLFRAEEDTCMRIFIDTSASLLEGVPSKLDTARKIAAAIGYVALASSERAQVLSGSETLKAMSTPARGRGGVTRLMKELSEVQARGRGDLAMCLSAARKASREQSVFVVLSDFFDAGPVSEALTSLASEGHTLLLVQVLSAEEANPSLEGDCTLVDSETGEDLSLTVDDASIAAYTERLGALFASLQKIARRSRGTALQIIGDESPPGVVLRLLGARRDERP
jgi:uncharacterized protein (DUF58 family)